MNQGPAHRRTLLTALLGTGRPELTCDECFDQLDRYVELTLAMGDPDRVIPGMHAHLMGCPACADDNDSLVAYISAGVADSTDGDLSRAVRACRH